MDDNFGGRKHIALTSFFLRPLVVTFLDTRAANLVDFYIEFKFEFSLFYEFEFNIFIFLSSSSAKIYQVFLSSKNKVIDLA